MIAAPFNLGCAQWGCQGTLIYGADAIAIGKGAPNTNDIVGQCTTAGVAAELCSDLELNGYSDWYLPSICELNKLYINKAAVGGFARPYYWSSTEVNGLTAWAQFFDDGGRNNINKNEAVYVRAIRAF